MTLKTTNYCNLFEHGWFETLWMQTKIMCFQKFSYNFINSKRNNKNIFLHTFDKMWICIQLIIKIEKKKKRKNFKLFSSFLMAVILLWVNQEIHKDYMPNSCGSVFLKIFATRQITIHSLFTRKRKKIPFQ